MGLSLRDGLFARGHSDDPYLLIRDIDRSPGSAIVLTRDIQGPMVSDCPCCQLRALRGALHEIVWAGLEMPFGV